jgi:hypothetical protein
MIRKLAYSRATEDELARFWDLVRRRGPNDCWPWLGSKVKGYARFKFRGRMVVASRFIYEQINGPLGDLDAAHICESKCCNPRHMIAAEHHSNCVNGRYESLGL